MRYNIEDVFVGIPTRGTLNWNHVRFMYRLLAENPRLNTPEMEAASLSVCHPRNVLAQKFLSSDAKVLFFIDDDVTPKPNVLDMLRHLNDYDIVGGPYPMVHPPVCDIPTPCALQTAADTSFQPLPEIFSLAGVHPCDALGTGCMMIRRSVLESPGILPFRFGVDEHGVMRASEDIMFCVNAKKAGFTLAADFDQIPDHCHTVSLNTMHNAYLKRMVKAIKIAQSVPEDQPLVTLA
jgi:hypothetical protein